MTDETEHLLRRFRPAGPPARLRERILQEQGPPALPFRRWPILFFRSAIAAMVLVSCGLLYAADVLNRDSARRVCAGPVRWTAEAQQTADLMGPSGRRYVALCLIAGNARPARYLPAEGVDR